MKYEYRVVNIEPDNAKGIEALLNGVGTDGWEVIANWHADKTPNIWVLLKKQTAK